MTRRAAVAALVLSAGVHALVLGALGLGRGGVSSPARPVARVQLRWIAAPLAIAPASREASTATADAPPRRRRAPLRPVAAAPAAPQAVVAAAPPAAASAAPPISGAVFALPRLGFAAGAGPARWMRIPAADAAGPERLAAVQQARAAQASVCARQAALKLRCDDAPDEAPSAETP